MMHSQALLANMAAMYAIYHGPEGLKQIANRVHGMAVVSADALQKAGYKVVNQGAFFDTLTIDVSSKVRCLSCVCACAALNVLATEGEFDVASVRMLDSGTLASVCSCCLVSLFLCAMTNHPVPFISPPTG